MPVPASIPVALLRVSRSGLTSFEPADYIGHTPNLVYVQLLTHPDQYTYWFDADKEPRVQALVKDSIEDASNRERLRRHIRRGSPRKTYDPLTGPWGVQTTLTHQFDALANVVVKGKKIIKDDPNMVPPFQGWHTESRMSEAQKLIARVVEGESPVRVVLDSSALNEETPSPELRQLRSKCSAICDQAAKDLAMAAEYAEKAENAMRGLANEHFMGQFHAGHAAPITKIATELDRETESCRTTSRQIKFGEYDRALDAYLRHPQAGR